MADTKISALASGAPVQDGDELVIARSGNNFKIPFSDVAEEVIAPIDITWANLMTALGGSTLVAEQLYHVTNAPDGSTTITEAWIKAIATNQLEDFGIGLVTTAAITDRVFLLSFSYGATAGERVLGAKDGKGNEFDGMSNTTVLDRWLNMLTANNKGVKAWGGTLPSSYSGTVGDGSVFHMNSGLDIQNGSFFYGTLEADAGAEVGLNATTNLNGCHVCRNGFVEADNGNDCANIYVGVDKNLDLTGIGINGFSTEVNVALQEDGFNASGDTVSVNVNTGTLFIVDGSTDVTISMPNGLVDGQKMTIIFKLAQTAIAWVGATVYNDFFPTSSGAPLKIEATWQASSSTWY